MLSSIFQLCLFDDLLGGIDNRLMMLFSFRSLLDLCKFSSGALLLDEVYELSQNLSSVINICLSDSAGQLV